MSQLKEGGGKAFLEHGDRYSGLAALKVTPDQKAAVSVPNWRFPIVEKPGTGEYRYLRFAWKKKAGQTICIQLNHDGAWGPEGGKPGKFRYHAGPSAVEPYGASLAVDKNLPVDWVVVTRDLFADSGPFTLQGIAFSPLDGEYGLFDHMYLSQTLGDLDRIPVRRLEPPRSGAPTLVIHCGRGKGQLQEELVSQGYGFELLQGESFDQWPASAGRTYCWCHEKAVLFHLRVPVATAGTLRLLLLDGDAVSRKQRVTVGGKAIGDLADFSGSGKWVEVPLGALDTKDGKVEVTVENTSGSVNAVVSEVEFTPMAISR